jgi:hypothetical protein
MIPIRSHLWRNRPAGVNFYFIGGGVAIGIGLAVMGFGSGRYYRTLGIAL